MILYCATICLNPKTKKNSQEIRKNRTTGKWFIGQNKAYEQYEKDAGWFLTKKPLTPIAQPVNVKCVFYRSSYIRCDLTNLLEAIDDILVKYKIIKDDNFTILVSHDGSRVCVDKNNPRTEITITSVEEP